jgi:ankyrin repeat protein
LDKTLQDIKGYSAEDYVRKMDNIRSQELLANELSATNLLGRSLLQKAVITNSHALVQLYLKLGAPINEQDPDGKSALHFAALCCQSPVMLMLCHYKEIEMDLVDKAGNTALHYSLQ